jgi:RNA polymerase sigma-70 factor (ECF subfamily)
MVQVNQARDWDLQEHVASARRWSYPGQSAVFDDRPGDDRGTILPAERSQRDNGQRSGAVVPGADPDQEIVVTCRAGDRQAFTRLVLRHKERVYTLAVRLLGDRGEAEEMAQETFLRAYERLEDFRGDARFSTWLYRICYNLCLSLRARKKSEPCAGPLPEGLPDPGARIPEQLIERERRELITGALSALPREFREVLVLYHTGQCSYEEIARVLSLPVGTVRSRLHRGREELKQLLRPYLQEEED